MPSYNLVDDLSKTNLLMYCLSTNLRFYFPDNVNTESVSRDFILKVIFNKDVEKFKSLELIAQAVNTFKSEKSLGGININVPKLFVDELNKFKSHNMVSSKSRVYSFNSEVFRNKNIQEVGLTRNEKKERKKRDLESFISKINLSRNVFNLNNVNNNIN